MSATPLPALIQRFFIGRLQTQPGASPHTVAAYRDTFRLLLAFVCQRQARTPSNLRLEDLDATLLSAFLDHLESQRDNCVKTRNSRLAALHAFFRFVSYEEATVFTTMPAGVGHPDQAARQALGRVSQRTGNRSAPGRTGPVHVARSQGPHAFARRRPDRAA